MSRQVVAGSQSRGPLCAARHKHRPQLLPREALEGPLPEHLVCAQPGTEHHVMLVTGALPVPTRSHYSPLFDRVTTLGYQESEWNQKRLPQTHDSYKATYPELHPSGPAGLQPGRACPLCLPLRHQRVRHPSQDCAPGTAQGLEKLGGGVCCPWGPPVTTP